MFLVGAVIYFFFHDYNKNPTILMCKTTPAHDNYIKAKGLDKNIPEDFILVIDRPWDIFIYPKVSWKGEKKYSQDYKVFKENLSKAKILFHLSTEPKTNDSYPITPGSEKNFPYKVLFLNASTLNIMHVDREKLSGRKFSLIANCRTWSMSMGRGGKSQI